MRTNAPKVITWWIAVIAGVLGILGNLGILAKMGPLVSLARYDFWLVAAAFILLVLATTLKDL